MQKVFTRPIPNLDASRVLARKLVTDYLVPAGNFTLFLEGGLGAGKTFLVREMLQEMGVTEEVTSPTYALVNEYQARGLEGERVRELTASNLQTLKPSNSPTSFAHFDFYRLEDPNDFFARGFTDIADDPKISCFVEWPEKISPEAKSSFSGKHYVLKVEFGIGVGMRKVTLLEK